MMINYKSDALKAQNYSSRGQRPRKNPPQIILPCKGNLKRGELVVIWSTRTGCLHFNEHSPRALPSATMDQAVGLDYGLPAIDRGLSPIAPLPTSKSLSFNISPHHFSTFSSQKMSVANPKNPLYLQDFGDDSLKSDLSQIKVNRHQKNPQIFSARLMGNHWEIRPKAVKKPCKISRKNVQFWSQINHLFLVTCYFSNGP
jgi:hypothetical protein